MPRKGRLHSNLRRLKIANLADHHDVWILAQKGPKCVRKGETDLRFHLDLIDSFKLIFDRILNGEDLSIRRVQFKERRVESRRLSAPGRTRDQENAVWAIEYLA